MNDKILIADIIAAVADATAISKNRCDDFVKAFFEAIAKALVVDGVAKLKGLGTFKLVAVEERKSVNVQTGAEMIIPAHVKVSFLPDKVLKDEINKPYAHLKTYVLNPSAPLDPPETDDDDSVADEVAEFAPTEVIAASVEIETNQITDAAGQETVSVATDPSIKETASDIVNVASSVSAAADTEKNAELSSDSASEPGGNQTEKEDAVISVATIEEGLKLSDSVTDTAESVEFNSEKKDSHADWFDNWEVEYDSVDNPDKDSVATHQETATSQPLFVDTTTNGNSITAAPVTDADDNRVVVETDSADSNKADVENVVADTAPVMKLSSDNQSIEQERHDDSDNVEQTNVETTPSDSQFVEQNQNEGSDNVEQPNVETTPDSVTVGYAEQNSEIIPEVENQSADAETVESVSPIAETQPIKNEVVDSATSNAEEQKVHGGKVLGVAIITFIILLVLAYFGLKMVDPDFFKSLKVNDNPPVMPSDSTSLAEELSIYENNAPANADTSAVDSLSETKSDNLQVGEQNSSAVVEAPKALEPEKKVVKEDVDPLWNKEFVSFMKKYPSVSLKTSGLLNEVQIKPGLFLTKVALDNYGDKAYWVYLYLYNKDRIKNPNNIPVGTKIRVPKLDASLVDGTNEGKLDIAKEVRQAFVR